MNKHTQTTTNTTSPRLKNPTFPNGRARGDKLGERAPVQANQTIQLNQLQPRARQLRSARRRHSPRAHGGIFRLSLRFFHFFSPSLPSPSARSAWDRGTQVTHSLHTRTHWGPRGRGSITSSSSSLWNLREFRAEPRE